MKEKSLRKPKWLKTTIVGSERFAYVNNIVEKIVYILFARAVVVPIAPNVGTAVQLHL